MATLTLPVIGGGELVLTHRQPRQTEVLSLLSRIAGRPDEHYRQKALGL